MADDTGTAVCVSLRLDDTVLSQVDSIRTCEPVKKKIKTEDADTKGDKLEDRLGGILCCAVCLDLPKASVFQCTNGHLMCAGCLTHLLADARLKDETATCPNCRIEISKTLCSRNLAVEKAVSELPATCQYCSRQLPRHILEKHQTDLCEERLTNCKFEHIGCPWKGPFHECGSHSDDCCYPHKSASQVLPFLQDQFGKMRDDKKLSDMIFELLSFEKITFNDLQFRPYRTDEYIHKLFYETSRFSAFNNQWVLKGRVNDNQRSPEMCVERTLSYQLVLKSKINSPLGIYFLVLKGPFGDMRVHQQLYNFEFTNENSESDYCKLPVADSVECNKLLASKAISFRLIMFQVENRKP